MTSVLAGLLTSLLSKAVNVKFTFVVSSCLLFYDTAINFSDEVELIWRKGWSNGKVMYLLTRYSCFLDGILVLWYNFHTGLTPDTCRPIYEANMWSMTFGIIVSEIVLILRTYAIWGRSLYVLAYLSIIQAAAIGVDIFELNQHLKSLTFIESPLPNVVPCVPVLGINKLTVVFVVIMGVDLNLLCLTLFKGLTQWRRNSIALIHTLYRDGVFYLVVLFSISTANAIIIIKFFNSPYYYLLFELQRVLHAVLASRLIINLKKAAAAKEAMTTLMNTMSFGDPPHPEAASTRSLDSAFWGYSASEDTGSATTTTGSASSDIVQLGTAV